MQIIKTALLSLSFLAAVCTMHSASAIAITNTSDITDNAAPTNQLVTFTSPYTLTFNIVDNGFVVGTDKVTSAQIRIHLTDSTGNETADVFYMAPNELYFSVVNIPNQTFQTSAGYIAAAPLSPAALADLNADGLLSFTVQARSAGDEFFFADSTLTATVAKGQAVPEPTTVALLGLGLLGFAALRRKSAKSKSA